MWSSLLCQLEFLCGNAKRGTAEAKKPRSRLEMHEPLKKLVAVQIFVTERHSPFFLDPVLSRNKCADFWPTISTDVSDDVYAHEFLFEWWLCEKNKFLILYVMVTFKITAKKKKCSRNENCGKTNAKHTFRTDVCISDRNNYPSSCKKKSRTKIKS